MNKAIVIAFTMKGQDVKKIIDRIEYVRNLYDEHILIQGFMPRKVLEAKKWSTDIVDALDHYFPIQINMNLNGAPLRTDMGEVAKRLGAKVVVIGDIIDGVKEEVDMYKMLGLEIIHVPLLS